MNKKLKSKKFIVVVPSLLLVLLLVGVGLFTINTKTWVFTPVYSDKKTAQQFLADVYSGNLNKAYLLTSDVFLTNNSYDSFSQNESQFTAPNMKTTYTAYATSKSSNLVSGDIVNVGSGQRYAFAIDLIPTSSGPKVDSVNIIQLN